eukprot:g3895.t1
MQPGSFYCYVPKKGAVSGWLPFCKQTQRGLYRRLNAVLKQGSLLIDGSCEENELLDDSDLYHCSQFNQATKTQSSVLPGAAICVREGFIQLTEHFRRKEPVLYSTEKALIVFYGYVSNLDDLCTRMGRTGSSHTKYQSFLQFGDDLAGGLDMTMGDITARVILHLYLTDKSKDPLLLLSDLQGHYAFVIYNSEDKNVFAARDASGKEPLYYKTDHEKGGGGVTLSNKPMYINELEEVEERGGVMWNEIPPGHYLYGRNPHLQQYALTPDQLTCRWSMDLDSELDLHFSLDGGGSPETRRSWSTSFKEPFLGHEKTMYESEFYPQTL